MNKKFLIFYTIFASAIFLFSILLFSVNLYKNYQNGVITYPSKTTALVGRLKNSSHSTFSSFQSNLEKNIKDYENIAAIEIKIDNKLVYSYPDTDFVPVNSRFVKYFNSKFNSDLGEISVDVNFYLLSPAAVTYFSRISFLIILIITLITVIFIIYLNVIENKSNSKYVEINDENSDSNNLSDSETFEINYSDDSVYLSEEEEIFDDSEVIPEDTAFELIENETSVAESETLEPDTNVSDVEDELAEYLDFQEDEVLNEEDSINLPFEEIKPVELKSEENSEIYNQKSGIGLETNLISRLDSEISRAISEEFDLALFILNIPEVTTESELYPKICSYLVNQFQFKDMIFEYQNDCFAAIKVNITLEESLDFAEKLKSEIRNFSSNITCFIGISTRSIRMVSGERLITEAVEAVKHAQEDVNSPVVAFRVDAEKYKEYMEKNNS